MASTLHNPQLSSPPNPWVLPEDVGALLEKAREQRHGFGVFSQQPEGASIHSQYLFNGAHIARGSYPTQETSSKTPEGAPSFSQQGEGGRTPSGSSTEDQAGKLTFILPAIQVRKAQADLESRALIGMIAGPRPPVDVLRGWIRNHWGSIGAEVEMVQALPKNRYVIVFKTLEIAFKVLSSGQWLIRTSPLCLFKWNKDYNPERYALNRFPVWVKFPNLPLHYHNHLRVIGSTMWKVLGGKTRGDYIPSWHPQALIEMDIHKELPQSIIIALDDRESF
ncbi:hypothetical protein L7F22_032360 [Adiantum nelumboides]|nr:hypothetical protein [Adiantum nelumboides]